MGYTHYLMQHRDLSTDEFEVVKNFSTHLFSHLEKNAETMGFNLAGPMGYDKPSVTDNSISFNGEAKFYEDHETCLIDRNIDMDDGWVKQKMERDGYNFTFCKTAHKPYDIAVVAIYSFISDRFGDAFVMDSDGEEEDLEMGKKLAKTIADEMDTPKNTAKTEIKKRRTGPSM